MSQRKPEPPGASRRTLLRTLGLGLPAAMACRGTTNPPAPPTTGATGSTGTTGSTADTGAPTTPSVQADERTPAPTAPWGGAAPVDADAFPLGAQTGEPTPDRLVVAAWAPGASLVDVQAARWDGSAWQPLPTASIAPDAAGYLHHTLTGLGADQPVAVQLVVDGKGSPVVHGRTAPDPDSLPEVFLGATSCLDQVHGEFPSLDEVQALGRLDAILWLGDTLYADGSITLDDYRAMWQDQLAKPSFQRLFATTPGIWTWDDHEVGNNWDPQTIDPVQLDAAVTAFHETVALPDDVRTTRRLWRSLRFGRTVELFVLDGRGERDASAGHYLSPEQLQWLIDGITASEAVWKVVATSVPITDMPDLWDLGEAQLDRWDGFPGTQRAELLAATEGIDGVFYVAGDLHQTSLTYVDRDGGPGARRLEIMAGPGGSFRNSIARAYEDDPQFVYADADWSATRLSFHPDGTARIEIAYEGGGPPMLDLRIDTAGNVVQVDAVRHPYLE